MGGQIGRNSRYSRDPITTKVLVSGSAKLVYELNGGKEALAVILKKKMRKAKLNRNQLSIEIGMHPSIVGGWVAQKGTGISMGAIRKVSKVVGMEPIKLCRKVFGKQVKGGWGKKAKAPEAPNLEKLMSDLGVSTAEAACSLTVGDERVTVERMPGQDRSQPIVVEHSGHRLTVEKV